MSGNGISWTICKSAPCSRQITTPVPHHSVFLQAGCPSCHPTNSVKALKANVFYSEMHVILCRLNNLLKYIEIVPLAVIVLLKVILEASDHWREVEIFLALCFCPNLHMVDRWKGFEVITKFWCIQYWMNDYVACSLVLMKTMWKIQSLEEGEPCQLSQ